MKLLFVLFTFLVLRFFYYNFKIWSVKPKDITMKSINTRLLGSEDSVSFSEYAKYFQRCFVCNICFHTGKCKDGRMINYAQDFVCSDKCYETFKELNRVK